MPLRRTTLLIPGTLSEAEARETIKTCGADIICLDLEDTVAPGRKAEARASIVKLLHEDIWGRATRAVRINAAASPFAHDDLVEVVGKAGSRIASLMLSKPESVDEILWIDSVIADLREKHQFTNRIGYVVGVESAAVLTHIDDYASCSPNVEALGFAIGDLSASLGINITGYLLDRSIYPGDLFHFHRARIILAARTHGLWALDSPWPIIGDLETLEKDARYGAAMGFDGKLVLMPAQVKVVHAAYQPTEAEVARARSLLEKLEQLEQEGAASGIHGIEFVDPVVIAPARAIIERAAAPL